MGLRAMLGPQEEEETRKQLEAQKTLESLAANAPAAMPPSQPVPETDLEAYQRLSQEAAEAGPTEQDVLAAGMRRNLAESRASTMPFLEQMAQTAFYKPDYSKMAKVAAAEAERPDAELTAKQQAQKRLEGLAEQARKKVLLPGQMKEQEAETAIAQARIDAIREASALKSKSNEPATPEQVQKFQSKFGKLNLGLPENPTQGQLSEAYEAANKAMGEYTKATDVARIGAASRQAVAETKGTPTQAQQEREERLKNKEVNTMITTLRNQYNKEVEGSKKGIEAADRIGQFADSKNWALLAAVGPQLAKGIGGDVGQLSNKDIARYDANPQLLTKYQDMIKKALTGEVTEATAQEYKDAAKVVKGLLQDKVSKKQDKYRKILTKNKLYTNLGGDEEYANEQLFGGEIYGTSAAPSAAAPASAAPKSTKQQKLDEIDKKMKELEEQLKSGK